MRLTHIKLAGFKSFVEPTQIPVTAELVAVCGPNGCGKSNVIDAVRWVLGESSARQLRGESMQDVIFNGSDQRKPAARASVELVFDNAQGRAAGAWSNYAEIAIKRVLTRAGDSSYYINNQQVRRRDITDLFLGTGVGARGYAVIEQGMISRIIEARPEELRQFLEEAAGVSKYKERRRETESRLTDARENLIRLEDIRQELDAQLEKLAGQAEVALHYRALQAEKQQAEDWLAWVRLREAEREQADWLHQGQAAAVEFEAAVAGLRAIEAELETLRDEHFAASDAQHAEQARLYEVNARLARLEQQITHVRESRERLSRQIEQERRELAQLAQNRDSAAHEGLQFDERLMQASQQLQHCLTQKDAAQAALPAVEQRARAEHERQQQMQQRVHEALRQQERLTAQLRHQQQSLEALKTREARTAEELRQWQASPHTMGDGERLLLAEQQLQQLTTRHEEARQTLQQARAELAAAEQDWRERRDSETALRARVEALQTWLASFADEAERARWLAEQGKAEAPALWSKLEIEPGWECAVEAALEGWLDAHCVADLDVTTAPPAAMSLIHTGLPAAIPTTTAMRPLLAHLRNAEALGAAVIRLLAPYYVQDDMPASVEALWKELPPGSRLVLPDGRLLGEGWVRFPGKAAQGRLARQAECQQLESALAEQMHEREAAEVRREQLRLAAQQQESLLQLFARELKSAEGEYHEARVEDARHAELRRHREAQVNLFSQRQGELAEERETLQLALLETEAALTLARDEAQEFALTLEESQHCKLDAEVALDLARSSLKNAERAWQEADFAHRLLQQQAAEQRRRHEELDARIQQLGERLETALLELELQDPTRFDDEIQSVIEQRLRQEQQLAAARDHVAELTARLKSREEARHAVEQSLEPLRQRIQQLQLKEQEARLHAQQQRELLVERDLVAIETAIPEDARPAQLAARITRLANAIESLGAVNLAAVDELHTARERKHWLDAQAEDLLAAIDTLSNAIARIDMETRERLLATYHEVNRNLSELFPSLFGGGRAELVLTGEEILDAGLQILAQPPGKKNASISLLSGGEKALTALSLVFSLFRLNPAPFCLLDEVDAPLDDANTGRFCELVKKMSEQTQFLYISHNRITMEMARQLVGITMQEKGVSRMVAVDIQEALNLASA